MHKRNVEDRRNSIKKLKRLIRQKDDENSSLDNDLEEISLSVAERRNVNDANGKENEKHINSVAFFLPALGPVLSIFFPWSVARSNICRDAKVCLFGRRGFIAAKLWENCIF